MADLYKVSLNWAKEIASYAKKVREKYTVDQIKEFHTDLDTRGIMLLRDHFDSFTWRDHYRVKVIGSAPQYYIFANTSDGTFNFLRGIPVHSTVISFLPKINESPVLSVVMDTQTGDVFIADREGARMNNKPIKSSEVPDLSQAVISVDPRQVNDKLKGAMVYRRLGSLALELSWIAAGGIDACLTMNELDMAHFPAPFHILEKAGGIVTDLDGKKISLSTDINAGSALLASANKNLHKQILESLEG